MFLNGVDCKNIYIFITIYTIIDKSDRILLHLKLMISHFLWINSKPSEFCVP